MVFALDHVQHRFSDRALNTTLLQAARRAPAREDKTGGGGDAGYTVKPGQPHYGYKAHVAVDETHTLVRPVTLTAANVHDRREFEHVVHGDEEMVIADKACWSQPDANGAGSRAGPTGFCASPAGGRNCARRRCGSTGC
jgi:IS5 family transposase